MEKRIWLITGISSGLGKEIAEKVMLNGDFVVGTFRQSSQVSAFNKENNGSAFAIKMDVADANEVQKAIELITEKFGRVDVLVNNAGFGIAGAVEETSEEETRKVFEANFYGALRMTQGILPLMRKQKAGHIIQISSHSGFKSFPGFGIYSASKFALEGFSEAVAIETAPLGIKVTIVEPGPFRTDFAGRSFALAAREIADYAGTAGVFRQKIKGVDGKQEGDPKKAAQAIFDLVGLENPPLRLPLGKIAVGTLQAKLDSVQKDVDGFREIAESVVFE
ncbi:oxidoreductase [Flammeovirgaceae bacterium SG7u.111]|nr:oxidoreductase [Flammeovirgaceae bacterium SG7u.132]WPO36246.1 oxidoreductase [Flammeovirgaceae bacterium SG7u.111]